MAAGLIVRFIGLIYRPLMKANIGELGYAYYGYAYNVYFILLLVSGYSIPVAVSKLMSERLAREQYKNAMQIFKGSLLYILIAGGLAASVAFFFPNVLLPKGGGGAALALKVLAPTILFSGILGVLRGYFQAHGNMMPTAMSQVLESIANALVAILMGKYFITKYAHTKAEKAVYGAAGSTLGPGAGIVIGIIFMLCVFRFNKAYIDRKLRKDRTKETESYGDTMRVILFMLTPVIFSTFAYNFIGYLDQTLFAPLMMAKSGLTGPKTAMLFNQFNGMYNVLVRIPMAFADASSTALIPVITASYALKDFGDVRSKINKGIRMTMMIAVPSVAGLSVLAYPATELLFGAGNEIASKMLLLGSTVVIFISLSTITTGILQGIGRPTVPLHNAIIATGIHALLLVVFVRCTPAGVYALLITYLIYTVTICALNVHSLKTFIDFKIDFKGAFKAPVLASAVMSAAVGGVYFGLHKAVRHPSLLFIAAVAIGIFVYLVAVVKISGMTEEEIRSLPRGHRLAGFLVKIHVL